MPQIKHNMEEESKRIDKFGDTLTEQMRVGMLRALASIQRLSAQQWLQGPRPERLGTASRRLIKAMQGGYSFSGGIKETGSASISSKEGYIKAEKVGNVIRGEVGLETFGPFDYPEYWEFNGKAHGGPRPFLNPAGQQALSSGLLDREIQTEVDKVKLD